MVSKTLLESLKQDLLRALVVLGFIHSNEPVIPSINPVEPPKPPAVPSFPPKIIAWAQAIGRLEGARPELNNPGNLKVSTLTKTWGAEIGRPASDGGYLAKFATLETGTKALCNLLVLACEDQLASYHSPQARTFGGFTKIYAGNPPIGYITSIADEIGCTLDTQISSFLI